MLSLILLQWLFSSGDSPLQPPKWLRGKGGGQMPQPYHPCPFCARLSPARRVRCAGKACPPGPALCVSWTSGNTLESGKWRRTSQQSPRHLERGIAEKKSKKKKVRLAVQSRNTRHHSSSPLLMTPVHRWMKEGTAPQSELYVSNQEVRWAWCLDRLAWLAENAYRYASLDVLWLWRSASKLSIF